MTSGGDDLYEVVVSPSFWEDWNEGVSEGWVNPMTHPSILLYYRTEVLPHYPFSGQQVPGIPANVRVIRFPQSLRGRNQIEIFYSVVVDDLRVILERIRLVVSE